MMARAKHRLLCGALLVVSGAGAAGDDGAGIATAARLMPAYLLEVPDNVATVLVAETDAATLHRFETADGQIVEQDERYMSIGLNGPGKEKAWDRRTPLGVYFITESLDTSKLHEKYGVAAFPLDYPNAWDRLNERTGDGIWLHGVDRRNPERPPRDTDGCLSLPNEDLLRLVDQLEPLATPVIVTRKMRWAPPSDVDELRAEFRLALDMWRESLAEGNVLAYLSMYADDFRYRGMDRRAWAAYRANVFAARKLDTVELKDVLLIADPETEELYLSRFTEVLATADGPVTTTKRLYWRRMDGNQWKIVSEDAG